MIFLKSCLRTGCSFVHDLCPRTPLSYAWDVPPMSEVGERRRRPICLSPGHSSALAYGWRWASSDGDDPRKWWSRLHCQVLSPEPRRRDVHACFLSNTLFPQKSRERKRKRGGARGGGGGEEREEKGPVGRIQKILFLSNYFLTLVFETRFREPEALLKTHHLRISLGCRAP